MATQTQDRCYYVIETSGDYRQMWGPYTLAHARRECGSRHVVVTGSGCRDGRKISAGELQAAQSVGSITPVDAGVHLVA